MFQFPVANVRVTCRFLIYNPFATTPRMHYGMDFGCAVGTPLFAANGGAVVWSGWDSAGGNMLILHDKETGELSRYAHLSRRDVRTGDTVTRGQQIGLTGNTGSATTGPHLHFETWRTPASYSYSYADRTKYAVDPMSVCHLLAGQTFDGNGLATREPIPYPEPDVGAHPMRGTVTAHKTAVRLRLLPEVTRYQYIVGGHNRADDVLGDLVAGTSFTTIATCDSDGYTWALIETNRGQFWVALLSGSTSLTLAQEPPAAPEVPEPPASPETPTPAPPERTESPEPPENPNNPEENEAPEAPEQIAPPEPPEATIPPSPPVSPEIPTSEGETEPSKQPDPPTTPEPPETALARYRQAVEAALELLLRARNGE